MMTIQFASDDYDDLTLDQRMDAMVEAREMARDDNEQNRELLIPFTAEDPRRAAYLSERKVR